VTGDEAIAALDLPAATRLDRRVPKTLLLEHGAPTTADRRRINEGIEQIQWVAALKPSTIGVAAYKDHEREYLEIAVLRVMLRPAAKAARLVELLHRAVPYPVFALAEQGNRLNLSLAHKRWSQGEAGKTVLDGELVADDAPPDGDPHRPGFAAAMALGRQPSGSLRTVYQGWIDALLALAAARRTGRFEIPAEAERRAARVNALRECARLDAEITRLRAAAKKEKQMPRQVALNLELKQAEAARVAALAKL
jgi:hypothetical protein